MIIYILCNPKWNCLFEWRDKPVVRSLFYPSDIGYIGKTLFKCALDNTHQNTHESERQGKEAGARAQNTDSERAKKPEKGQTSSVSESYGEQQQKKPFREKQRQ